MLSQRRCVTGGNHSTHLSAIHHVNELVINWHVTEACNYHCQYCYSRWEEHPDSRELFHDSNRTFALLSELFRFFRPENQGNPLKNRLGWPSVRLNLAGGEPSILGDKLIAICRMAKAIGFKVSIISNGSRLSSDMIGQIAPNLSCLGVSIDSISFGTNERVGRSDRKGQQLAIPELARTLRHARSNNPNLTLKLNTVVNRLNAEENLSGLIQLLRPDRWKIFRMLPVIGQSLAISNEQFLAFINRHRSYSSIQCIEDHQDMLESYLMIDPHGRFFQNDVALAGQGYSYSQPILANGAEAAFSEMRFDATRFQARYRRSIVRGGS
jgi:radical S-adenosyl methionine domain-containing protein 2